MLVMTDPVEAEVAVLFFFVFQPPLVPFLMLLFCLVLSCFVLLGVVRLYPGRFAREDLGDIPGR